MNGAEREPQVSVIHLVKRYRHASRDAVDDISFEVGPGEFFALLGPNGAGKTTTISILTTTLAPTSGTVRIAGHDLARHPERVRRRIGIIFQHPSLDGQLTAEQHVRLHVSLYGLYGYRPTFAMMPSAYRERLQELADLVGLRDHLCARVSTFSGGMKRKLEVVRALMHEPAVLFLDEPTSGLDAESRASVWAHLRAVREARRTTIFLTTHYIEEAEGADRVCIIDRGSIRLLDTPDAMKRRLTNRFLLVDAADRVQLRGELLQLGARFSERQEGFSVPYADTTAQGLIARLATPLTTLRMHEPTLEQAYVELVRTGRDEEDEQVT